MPLSASLTEGIDTLRRYLVDWPLGRHPGQVNEIGDGAVSFVQGLLPGPVRGATVALNLLAGAVLVVVAVFFLPKDGLAGIVSWPSAPTLRWKPETSELSGWWQMASVPAFLTVC